MALDVALNFGPLLIGCCVDILLQGILFVQFVTYFQQYHGDRLLLKLAVSGLILFTTLKSCQSFAMLWLEFIDTFNNADLAYSNYADNWIIRINLATVAIVGSYVRAYFCYRLYAISKAWWAVGLVASTDVLALGFALASYLQNSTDRLNIVLLYFTLHFSLVFIGDLLLTLLTAFFLTRYKKEVLPRARGTINALIRLTFETAAPSAVCSLISLVLSQLPTYSMVTCFNEMLPKLYAVSMMWTLNARQELRSLPWGNGSTLSYITSENISQLATTDQVPSMKIHHDAVELRRLSNGP